MQRLLAYSLVGIMLLTPFFTACTAAPTPAPTASPAATRPPEPTPAPEATSLPKLVGAFESGQYRNLFKELLGKSEAEIQQKIDRAWQQLFYGDDQTERVYYPAGPDMAYIKDIGSDDIRSEGMSYGMMLAVQLNHPEEFDRLWKWAATYMLQKDGPYRGYFAWHNQEDGQQIDANPASDGEEWFAMALLFAANRWGNGEGLFNYQAQAQKILDTMLHKNEENTGLATNMFDPETKQVVFVPSGRNATFTDPSYHLPAFYELWARWAAKDNDFWKEAAQASRAFWKKAAHPQTGLMPDYAEFDGTPTGSEHKDFRYDAFRNAAHVAQDWAWFAVDPWQVEQSNRLLDFFRAQGLDTYGSLYTIAGKPLSGDRSAGLVAMNAVAGLAADPEKSRDFVQALWDVEIPTGRWRYYDGLLYFLGLLHVSGHYRIYTPEMPKTIRPTPTPDPLAQAKFAPRPDGILFSVGQDPATLQDYHTTVGIDPGGVALATSLQRFDTATLDALIEQHPQSAVIVGLRTNDSLEAINAGQLDQQIDQLLDRLAAARRPILLRFGYDFDSAWNRYDPVLYRQAWIKFYQRMKEKQVANIALVWHGASDCQGRSDSHPLQAWYPGDEYVDWVGSSYFAPATCAFAPLNEVLDFARQHGKPVMIAATPQGYDFGQLTYSLDGENFRHKTSGVLWKEWFVPFFEYIGKHRDVIKAVVYYNTAWSAHQDLEPPYADGYWGDARVQNNRGILAQWQAQIGDARYWQAGPELFAKLGYLPAQP